MSLKKDHLYALLEQLNDQDVDNLIDITEALILKRQRDFEKRHEEAPFDEEPLTQEDIEAVDEARKDLELGQTLSFNEVFKKHDV